MSNTQLKRFLPLLAMAMSVAFVTFIVFDNPSESEAAGLGPIKEILSSRLGWEINETGSDICHTNEKCQPAKFNDKPGGFEYLADVAGAPNGNIYVVDKNNYRVQEFTAAGEFVLMFGKEVNRKGGDICTKTEENECQAGKPSPTPGQLDSPRSATVDSNGNVYVAEFVFGESGGKLTFGQRVQEFTANGVFVLEIGKEVNETTKGNLCTQVEASKGIKCTGPAKRLPSVPYESGTEHGSFNFAETGDILAVGGENGLLYVGDEGRVQEFETDGQWKGEITGLGLVAAVAVDDSCLLQEPALSGSACESFDPDFGDIYITNESSDTVQWFSPTGQSLGEPITITPAHTEPEAHAEIKIEAMTIDPDGRLALAKHENFNHERKEFKQFSGTLYHASTGEPITEFAIPIQVGSNGIGFNGKDQLYVAADGDEVLAYTPVAVAALATSPSLVPPCEAGSEETVENNVTFDCSLKGEVDPYNVASTEVWFEWGETCAELNHQTKPVPVGAVEELLPVETTIDGLSPNQPFCYRLAGTDANTPPPEQLDANQVTSHTPIVPPKIIGEPNITFVKPTAAGMSGELNPENTTTNYYFEYGSPTALEQCPTNIKNTCPGVLTTATIQSSLYGKISTTIEATGLQPNTQYAYRLATTSTNNENTHGTTSNFTTQPIEEQTEILTITRTPPELVVLSPPPTPTQLSIPKIAFPNPTKKCKQGYELNKKNTCVKTPTKKKKAVKHKKKNKKKTPTPHK